MAEIVNISNEKPTKKPNIKLPIKKPTKLFKIKPQKENTFIKKFIEKEQLEEIKEEIENKKEITNGFKEVILNVMSMPIKKEKQKRLYTELKQNSQINKTIDNKLKFSLFERLNDNMLFLCNYALAYNNAYNEAQLE